MRIRIWRLEILIDTDCRRCGLSRKNGVHAMTAAECDVWMRANGSTCANSQDHHGFGLL